VHLISSRNSIVFQLLPLNYNFKMFGHTVSCVQCGFFPSPFNIMLCLFNAFYIWTHGLRFLDFGCYLAKISVNCVSGLIFFFFPSMSYLEKVKIILLSQSLYFGLRLGIFFISHWISLGAPEKSGWWPLGVVTWWAHLGFEFGHT
jgi:hypothetical protein